MSYLYEEHMKKGDDINRNTFTNTSVINKVHSSQVIKRFYTRSGDNLAGHAKTLRHALLFTECQSDDTSVTVL